MRRLGESGYPHSSERNKKHHGHRLHLAIEGIDGTGKTTALSNTAELLTAKGFSVATLRYTGRTGITGYLITSIYHQENRNVGVRAIAGYRPLQAALYATNGRINLLRRERGADILLADRSILSGYASHVGRVPEWLLSLTESTHAPDVVAYLELPLDRVSERIDIREEGSVGYEEDVESLQKFSDDYETVFANPPRRLRNTVLERVDASRGRDEVAQSIADIALKHL